MKKQEVKRKLTKKEIEHVLSNVDFGVSLTTELRRNINNTLRKNIETKLKNAEIYPSLICELKRMIETEYHKTRVHSGENVGIITAQSIGERQTQLTLNSFHQAGLTVKTVVTGVPRFTELMNTSRDPKGNICYVPLKEKQETITDVRKYIGNTLKEIRLKHVVKYTDIIDIPDCWWLDNWFLPKDIDFSVNKKILRYTLRKDIIYNNRLSLYKIKRTIEDMYKDIHVCPSSLEDAILDIIIKNPEQVILTNGSVQYVNEENKFNIYLDEVVDKILKDFVVSGIEGIKDFIIRRDGSDLIIETEGTNFKELISHPKIQSDRVVSNNMWDIYEMLGIEAARDFLISEFTKVVSSDGTYINPRHISVLVDTMTYRGNITSISRYSVRNKTSPMARASFEESVDNFLKSGVYCEKEKLNSISSNIMVAKKMKSGTGICDMVVDISKILNRNELSYYSLKEEDTFNDLDIKEVLDSIFDD